MLATVPSEPEQKAHTTNVRALRMEIVSCMSTFVKLNIEEFPPQPSVGTSIASGTGLSRPMVKGLSLAVGPKADCASLCLTQWFKTERYFSSSPLARSNPCLCSNFTLARLLDPDLKPRLHPCLGRRYPYQAFCQSIQSKTPGQTPCWQSFPG